MRNKFIKAILFYIIIQNGKVNATELNELSQSYVWNNILFYVEDSNGQRSSLLSNSHLLSVYGYNNPLEELKREIAILEDKNKTHIMQCNYPRRTKFIKDNVKVNFIKANCPELKKWKNQFKSSDLKIFITSGKVDQPQSMFGHIFLAIPSKTKNSIMTYKTINYMADTSDEFIKYGKTIDGLVGNYKNEILIDNFYNTHKYYSKIDSRGMWEYDYHRDDIEDILLLIYELRDHALRYFFIDENCASSTMKILNHNHSIIYDESYYLPIDLIRDLNENNIISFSKYWPSDKEVIIGTINNENYEQEGKYHLISNKISSGDYDYDEGMILAWENLDKRDGKKELHIEGKGDITLSHKKSSLSILYLNKFDENWLKLNYSFGYHDFLSPVISRDKGVNVTLLDGSIIAKNEELKLDNLDLFEISTIQDSFNELPSASWTTSYKYESYQHEEKHGYKSKLYLYYGLGKKISDFSLALMTGPKIKHNDYHSNDFDATIDINFVYLFQSNNLNLNFVYNKEINNENNESYDFGLSYNNNSDYSFILSLHKDNLDLNSGVGIKKFF